MLAYQPHQKGNCICFLESNTQSSLCLSWLVLQALNLPHVSDQGQGRDPAEGQPQLLDICRSCQGTLCLPAFGWAVTKERQLRASPPNMKGSSLWSLTCCVVFIFWMKSCVPWVVILNYVQGVCSIFVPWAAGRDFFEVLFFVSM